jgi:hypothetical protein
VSNPNPGGARIRRTVALSRVRPVPNLRFRRPPEHDELEVTVLGNTYGESVCVHLGGGKWMIVDSFRRQRARKPLPQPAALEYLAALDVDLAEVAAIVLTHGDTDHCVGASALAQACSKAEVYLTAAMAPRVFFSRVKAKWQGDEKVRRATQELILLLEVLDDPHNPRPPVEGQAKLPIWTSPDRSVRVRALSPSSTTVDFSRRHIGRWLDGLSAKPDSIGQSHDNNHVSIATAVESDELAVLLGGDLEEHSNPKMGWAGVVADLEPGHRPADLVKIAHHGSDTSKCDELWEPGGRLLADLPDALLAPWQSGGTPKLPTDDMIDYFATRTNSLWSASYTRRSLSISSLDSEEASASTRLLPRTRPVRSEVGWVTARRKLNAPAPWDIVAVRPGAKL